MALSQHFLELYECKEGSVNRLFRAYVPQVGPTANMQILAMDGLAMVYVRGGNESSDFEKASWYFQNSKDITSGILFLDLYSGEELGLVQMQGIDDVGVMTYDSHKAEIFAVGNDKIHKVGPGFASMSASTVEKCIFPRRKTFFKV